jgi:DNA-binding NarL/FixJ family response regulator
VNHNAEALRGISEKAPDVVLMDIKLPGISGIQCVTELKRLFPKLQVIMVNISVETVRTYVKGICSKMHVRSRIEAVAKYQYRAA